MTATVEGTSTATRKPRQKPARKASYHAISSVYGTLELTVGEGEKVKVYGYHCERLASDFGVAFRLDKYLTQREEGEPTAYAVLLDLNPAQGEPARHSCECKGYLRWAHCKHLESLLALYHAGKLSCSPVA